MKKLIITSLLGLTGLAAGAQEKDIVSNEALLKQYLSQEKFDIDTTARAVVLSEYGYAQIREGHLEYTVDRTVKILGNEAAGELGMVVIPRNRYTSLSKLKGETYNLENGKVEVQAIHNSEVLLDKINRQVNVSKFNLPSVKKGSVIHYSYTLFQPVFIYIPEWNFQSEYPTLFSQYEINIPFYFVYTPIERVNVNMLKVNKRKETLSCQACTFQETEVEQTTTQIWTRRNIPAFHKEPMMSSEDNFKERVKVHVNSLAHKGYSIHIYNNWNEYSKDHYFNNKEHCGQAYAANNFLKEGTAALVAGKQTETDKARAIYRYLQDSVAEAPASGSNNDLDIKEVYAKRKGTGAAINLLLTAMLRKAGLNSEPVLLSTRSKEKLNPIFPDPDNINYVVSKVTADGRTYFLDASEKHLPFGILLPECYNGYCRVVNERGGSAELHPDSIIDKTTIVVSLAPEEGSSSRFRLKVDKQFGTFSSLPLRKNWQTDTAIIRDHILKELATSTFKTQLAGYTYKNIDNPEMPLNLHYEADVQLSNAADLIYLDPYFCKFFDKNPFSAIQRIHDIEMDYRQDINYVFRLQVPQGYALDDYPKSAIYKFGENNLIQMKNLMGFDEASNSFSLNSRFTTNTTTFSADYYSDLRSFYEQAIEEQKKKLVLKKLN